jgi:hypothetical protein
MTTEQLSLAIAVQRARESGYNALAVALAEMLRRSLKK